MNESISFQSREDFHTWLGENCLTSGGVWLLLGKAGGPKTLKASEALEEALCFGWIDGQMQSLDDKTYIKYFAPRRPNSQWSEKNKALAENLIEQGKMTAHGHAKIAEAKKSGGWNTPKAPQVGPEQIALVADLLQGHEPARTNYLAMSPSVQKTYARAWLDAKTDAGKQKRLAWMVERLDKNLKPM